MLEEGWPKYSTLDLLRSALIFISTLGLLLSLLSKRRPQFKLDENNTLPLERLSILGALFTSITFVSLFLLSPFLFRALSMEDRPIEWGSFILLLASSILFAVGLFKNRGLRNSSKFTALSIAGLSFIFALIAMEEVSWFQRQLDIATPLKFEGNIQNEINLHNFATGLTENMYYFSTFIFLVLLPFSRLFFPILSTNNYFKIIIPTPFIAIIGSIACAYNFDLWNVIFSQTAFFGSVIILYIFMKFSKENTTRYISMSALALLISTQLIFLLLGARFERIWDVTEYREFLIPLAFFIYSLDVYKSHLRVPPAGDKIVLT